VRVVTVVSRRATRKLFVRTKAYVLERLLPVLMLWLGISLAIYFAASYEYLKNGKQALSDFSRLVDIDSLALPILGVIVIKVIFGALDVFGSLKPHEQKNAREFMRRLWDEISGAATHLSCSVAIASFGGAHIHNAQFLCLASLLFGWMTYRFKPNEANRSLSSP
jgi:hypothetical protein